MKFHGRSVRRDERGQSLAELAIALPVLLALVVGIFEFGRAWNVRQVLTAASREGARIAVIPTATQADVEADIDQRLTAAGLDPDAVAASITGIGGGTGSETSVQLSTDYEFTFLGPVVGLLGGSGLGGTITLTTTAVMRNE